MSKSVAPTPALASLVVASNNLGKIAELHELLYDLPLEWFRPSDVTGTPFLVDENGDSFEQNAILKARAACLATGYIALADDSGLEVDALSGRPGVRSARFAHEHASDAENNSALLEALNGVDDSDRSARFRCALAVSTPFGHAPLLAFGSCEGRIAHQLRGQGGFGYDPLFIVRNSNNRSMAELETQEKNLLSHRAVAVSNLRQMLSELILSMIAQLDEAMNSRLP